LVVARDRGGCLLNVCDGLSCTGMTCRYAGPEGNVCISFERDLQLVPASMLHDMWTSEAVRSRLGTRNGAGVKSQLLCKYQALQDSLKNDPHSPHMMHTKQMADFLDIINRCLRT